MELDTATISVITSGIVAIGGILIPLLINYVRENQKWLREQKAAERDNVNQASIKLLKFIAMYRSGDIEAAARRDMKDVYGDFLGKYYVWEQIVWPYLESDDKGDVLELRKTIEKGSRNTFYEKGPDLANNIIRITQNRVDKIR